MWHNVLHKMKILIGQEDRRAIDELSKSLKLSKRDTLRLAFKIFDKNKRKYSKKEAKRPLKKGSNAAKAHEIINTQAHKNSKSFENKNDEILRWG